MGLWCESDGCRHLLEATRGTHSLICSFLLAARAGNQGQSDYAAANESLNKLAWMLQNTVQMQSGGWGLGVDGNPAPKLILNHGSPIDLAGRWCQRPCLECQEMVRLVVLGGAGIIEAHSRQSFSIYLHEQLQPELLDHQIQERWFCQWPWSLSTSCRPFLPSTQSLSNHPPVSSLKGR